VIFWRVGFAGVCPAGVHLAASRRRVHNAQGIQKKKRKAEQDALPMAVHLDGGFTNGFH